MTLVLASASPARLGVLRAAGVDPMVRVSGVDEDVLTAALRGVEPTELVTALARAKAEAVAATLEFPDAVAIGCDSMLYLEGELVGKPGSAAVATQRWQRMAGGVGELLTGHAVVRRANGIAVAAAEGAERTLIRFGSPSAAEIDAYVATGEPLQVAGGFTLEGLGGWFIDGIDGNPSSVIGISLPLTRRLLADIGVAVPTLWAGAFKTE
ncbi:MAG: Maf-like protein [Actinomycetota bacterium]|nr:Maf-like protein [Actinomycetota bacterium]